MNAKQFVACWKQEKDSLLKAFTDPQGESVVAQKITSLKLTTHQQTVMNEIVDSILVDTMYTLLLGLDGEANIGGVQSMYKIHDETEHLISDCGEIEAEAWKQFHGEQD